MSSLGSELKSTAKVPGGWDRRTFLRRAGQGLAVAAASGLIPLEVEAQIRESGTRAGVRPGGGTAAVAINVRELGARGDGATKDTAALQQALDRCAVLGGGEVVIPAGEYLSGALRIHSRTTLRIEEGASLMGSPDIADYPLTQVRWEGRWIKGYSAFLSAEDAENIALIGKGKIVASPAIKGRVVRSDGSPIGHAADLPEPHRAQVEGPLQGGRMCSEIRL